MLVFNPELQHAFNMRADYPQRVRIGKRLGEGMYSVAYSGLTGAWRTTLRTVRFFKRLGPNDRLEAKQHNIEKEAVALRQMEESGVNKALEVRGIQLREILYTGPQENGVPVFWDQNPIHHDGKEFVAYQLCKFIPGDALNSLTYEQINPAFAESIGEQFGIALALFHHAAREVAFPAYRTKAELQKNDHAYRHVLSGLAKSEEAATQLDERKIHAQLAARLNRELLPLYEPGTLEGLSRPIHGDFNLGNILAQGGGKLTGFIDWDKARNSIWAYDFHGIAIIPGALDAAAKAYEKTMFHLTGSEVVVDKALVCKLGLGVHLTVANSKDNLPKADGRWDDGARRLCAAHTLLKELAKLDNSYIPFRDEIGAQATKARQRHPGLTLA